MRLDDAKLRLRRVARSIWLWALFVRSTNSITAIGALSAVTIGRLSGHGVSRRSDPHNGGEDIKELLGLLPYCALRAIAMRRESGQPFLAERYELLYEDEALFARVMFVTFARCSTSEYLDAILAEHRLCVRGGCG